MNKLKYLGIGIILLAIYLIIEKTIGFNYLPEMSNNMGYGILFLIGVLTSFHCLAMCGGLAISQTIKKEKLLPTLFYNIGRVISYTVLGGIVGGIGSVVSFSGPLKGIVAIMAGILMIIMGFSMLNLFPQLRRIIYNIRLPITISVPKNSSPLVIGLLNGFMPCGPLQTMQLYALGTGSISQGALSMFIFALGTMPLMFFLGYLTAFLSNNFTNRMLKLGGGLIVILGLVMASRGLVLAGFLLPSANPKLSSITNSKMVISEGKQIISMSANERGYSPEVFFAEKGIPVKWIIKGEKLTFCNNELMVPEYNIRKKLLPGENVIEFTPREKGDIGFSCWMGMLGGRIKVVDNLDKVTIEDSCSELISPREISRKDFSFAILAAGKQKIAMKIDTNGYTPRVFLVEKGKPVEFIVNLQNISSSNYTINFLDATASKISLDEGKNVINFTPKEKVVLPFISSSDGPAGYIVVVDDLNKVDSKQVLQKIKEIKLIPKECSGDHDH